MCEDESQGSWTRVRMAGLWGFRAVLWLSSPIRVNLGRSLPVGDQQIRDDHLGARLLHQQGQARWFHSVVHKSFSSSLVPLDKEFVFLQKSLLCGFCGVSVQRLIQEKCSCKNIISQRFCHLGWFFVTSGELDRGHPQNHFRILILKSQDSPAPVAFWASGFRGSADLADKICTNLFMLLCCLVLEFPDCFCCCEWGRVGFILNFLDLGDVRKGAWDFLWCQKNPVASVEWKGEGRDVNSELTELQVSTQVLLLNLSGC